MPLRHGDFVLDPDVTEGLDIEFGSSDPTETLAKRVVRVHHIPMTSGVGHGDRALGPVVVPLRHLNKRHDGKQHPKETGEHKGFTFLNILAGFCGLPLERFRALGAEEAERPIAMSSLVVRAGVAATTRTRLVRTDDKAASALSLDQASKIMTGLDGGIEDLLGVVEAN